MNLIRSCITVYQIFLSGTLIEGETMAKQSAFGTVLNMGVGDVQIETATVVGTITEPGNVAVVVTAANMVETTLAVPVLDNDTATLVAGRIRAFIIADATAAPIRALFNVSGATTAVILTRKIPMADDATLNIATATGSATGLTTEATSADTHAGETLGAVAYIQSLSGPGLSLDTEDVTTHDSSSAFEEVVATILRSGELSMDIVYDPNDATHDATTGLPAMMEARIPVGFSMVFPDTTEWAFAAYVTGFEPGAPHDGALTAAVNLKLTGAPILA
jgi:predicted secreted protein